MIKQPFFSLLLPTRDRPKLVEIVLTSIARQTYKNFELIISDNYLTKPCYDICMSFKEQINIKYVHPDKPLSMADNFENALSYASGDYIIAIEDKLTLYSFALADIAKIVVQEPYDIVNYHFDTYNPTDDNYKDGTWLPSYNIYPAETFISIEFLKRRARFHINYARQSLQLKVRNKIFSGCWSKELVSRIKKKHTSLFQPLCPDYTSMALGSIYSRTPSYDMGVPIGLAVKSDKDSNGMTMLKEVETARRFYQESDPHGESLKYSPVGDCLYIQCAAIAADFIKIFSQSGLKNKLQVGFNNLYIRVDEELKQYKDLSLEEYKNIVSMLPKPSMVWKYFDKYYNYIYAKYHPFYIWLYLKVNILGRIGIKKYSNLLRHREFCRNYERKVTSFTDILNLAEMHYQSIL